MGWVRYDMGESPEAIVEKVSKIVGMPKAIEKYIDNNRIFVAADMEKRDILSLYRSDISKIDRNYRSKVLSIFDQIALYKTRSAFTIFHSWY